MTARNSCFAQLSVRQSEADVVVLQRAVSDQDRVASARCRSRCILSSREVKSTGEYSRVVILPSTVMAKVAATNGRDVRTRRA